MRRKQTIAVFAALAMLLLPAAGQTSSAPARQRLQQRLNAQWDELMSLLSEEISGPAEWARGIYLGVRLLSIGPDGKELMGSRFARARTPEAAFLSAVYLAVHGDATDRWFVRRELETNKVKRSWLKAALGTGRAITDSMNQGTRWEATVQHLPSPVGCRLLARNCMRSKDVLVRRGGLMWGFWVADNAYWRDVRAVSQKDPDRLTQRFAALLLQRRVTAR